SQSLPTSAASAKSGAGASSSFAGRPVRVAESVPASQPTYAICPAARALSSFVGMRWLSLLAITILGCKSSAPPPRDATAPHPQAPPVVVDAGAPPAPPPDA